MTQWTYTRPRAKFGLMSLLAIAAAGGSFFVHWGLALLLAFVAIIFGAVGFVVALLPGRRGGVLSIVAIMMGAIGVVVALIRLVL